MTRIRHHTHGPSDRLNNATAMMAFCMYVASSPLVYADDSAQDHRSASNENHSSLEVMMPHAAPLGLWDSHGKPIGVAVDYINALSYRHTRPLQPKPTSREAIDAALSNADFQLALAYATPERDERFVNLGLVREVRFVQLQLAHSSPDGGPVGYLTQIAPPPHQIDKDIGFQDINDAANALKLGQINALVLPEVAVLILADKPPLSELDGLKVSSSKSLPTVIYARPGMLAGAEVEVLRSLISTMEQSAMFDRFLESFYSTLADQEANPKADPDAETSDRSSEVK